MADREDGNHNGGGGSHFADPDQPGRDAAHDGFADQLLAPATEWAETLQWSKGKTKTNGRRRLQLVVSYAPDWILTLLLAGMLAFLDTAHGFRREFSLTDPSLQHTYAEHQRVPMWLLVLLAVIVPICIQALISLVVARSFWDFHASLLGLVVTHALTVTTTTIIKISVGRPRPDLIDRCQPRAGATNAPIYGLVTDAICTNPLNEHLVSDGFRSFPSGHSSAAFAGLTFLSLYLGGKFHLFGRKGHAGVSWIVWLPMLGATMIAVSRTMDYRHHATDVIAGGILGAGVAVGTYFLYYPSLWDSRCHKPWAPRVPRYRLQRGVTHQADVENAGSAESRHRLASNASGSSDYGEAQATSGSRRDNVGKHTAV